MNAARHAVAAAHGRDWSTVLAATVRVARDLDLAEDCVQEAYAAALTTWERDGVPDNPAAWLTTTARRRAVDAVRREVTLRGKLPLLVVPDEPADQEPPDDADVGDERLRLIFLCCHPALPQDGQLALTLRLVCGLSTPDVARLLLVSEPTMAARITRAKRKIALARIPFRVPRAAELPDRVRGVLGAVHLLFSSGHVTPGGDALTHDAPAEQAIRLARVLREVMPDDLEVRSLLALLLATHGRRATRVDEAGALVRLADQDRSSWDRTMIAEAADLLTPALHTRPQRYALQAAIALEHAQAPSYAQTNWSVLLALYDRLSEVWPSPVVELNRAVVVAEVHGPAAALAEVEALEGDRRLAGYPYLAAIKADLLTRLGRVEEAVREYVSARDLTANAAEGAFLSSRIDALR